MTLSARHVRVVLARREALKAVDFQANPGEIHAIVGPNGAGKTTLLRALASLVPLESGSIHLDGRDLRALAHRERARLVGYVPHQGHLEYPFTVREVVEMGRYAHGDRATAAAAPVEAALRDLQLTALANRPVTQLSGGERERVLIARVLSQDPKAILLDEPLANLDLAQAGRLMMLLREKARQGRIVVATMHDLETASRVADRFTLLHVGTVLRAGLPREVLSSEHVSQAFGARIEVQWHEGAARFFLETKQNG